MASWLKRAEDLFEVVDRRAKLVVGELGDEQSDLQPSASNGQGSQPKRTKTKAKAQAGLSANRSLQSSESEKEQTKSQTSLFNIPSVKGRALLSVENEESTSSKSVAQTDSEKQKSSEKDSPRTPASKTQENEADKHEVDHVDIPITVNCVETATSNGELLNEKNADVPVECLPSPLPGKEIEVVDEDHPRDAVQNVKLRDADVPSRSDQEMAVAAAADSLVNSENLSKGADLKVEALDDLKKQWEHEADTSPSNIQDQLDEAQGLLKSAVSTGQSKEARLARVCAGLHSRLQEYKSENAQLEELLIAERELSKSYEACIKQLQQDLSISKSEVTRIESNMAEALAAKNSEIEAVVSSMEVLKKQAALSEGNLASLQANVESIMRNRELTETRMMQALREELASAERRAEEERAAHNATKMAAMEREVELEHRAVEASNALARIQRIAEERTAKAAELEQKVALLEVECSSLNQELQDMEARARRGQKKSPEEANQVIQIQAWQEEVERARLGQRDAESKLSSLEAELQKTRVEMAAMKRDAEHYSRQEHMELEKRYRELTDLLYYKQTQLESMASEKAAAEFQLEKELKRLQEAQMEAERSRVSRRPSSSSSSWEEDTEMKALEPLPLYHRHMVGASIQLQKAAKLLDSGAARATRFLWRYPTARLLLLFYLVFVHLFLMYLLHHLQEQADTLAAREVAESMGLTNPTLP